jgi:hypothetical protein
MELSEPSKPVRKYSHNNRQHNVESKVILNFKIWSANINTNRYLKALGGKPQGVQVNADIREKNDVTVAFESQIGVL